MKEYIEQKKKLAYDDMRRLIRGITDLDRNTPIVDGEAKFIVLDYYHSKYLRWEAEAEISTGRRRVIAQRRAMSCLYQIEEFESEKRLESPQVLRGRLPVDE